MIPHNATFCQYMYLISNLRVPMLGTAVDANARAPPILILQLFNYIGILQRCNMISTALLSSNYNIPAL